MAVWITLQNERERNLGPGPVRKGLVHQPGYELPRLRRIGERQSLTEATRDRQHILVKHMSLTENFLVHAFDRDGAAAGRFVKGRDK